MVEYEDECVGCPAEIGCLGSTCPYKRVPHYYCDGCGKEIGELEHEKRDGLCEDCYNAENGEQK